VQNATHRFIDASFDFTISFCVATPYSVSSIASQFGTPVAVSEGMKIAIPVWQGRISPVFDVAGQVLLVDWDKGTENGRDLQHFVETASEDRARRLAALGVETLICAGISQPLEDLIVQTGIRVIARICGDVQEVLAAFAAGQLGEKRFAMPGCCAVQRRQRRRGS
jgi:predicted Fe-Mo cluster-binding NifX family protein